MNRVINRWWDLATRLRHPRFVLSRLLWESRLCSLFVIDRGSFKLRFHPSALSANYWANANVLKNDEDLISTYLRPGDVMIDVGANIGALSLAAAAVVGSSGRVVSIEPHPRTFRYLSANVELNRFRNMETYNYAIGAAPGKVAFSDRRSDDQNAISDQGAIQVGVVTLDSLLASGVDKIAMLKVDVEGYEKFVFEGARQVLEKTELVYFEVFETHFTKRNYSTADLQKILRDAGFSVYRLVDGRLVAVPKDYIADHCHNLLAIRNFHQVEERLGLNR